MRRQLITLVVTFVIAIGAVSPSERAMAQQGQGPESGLPEVDGWAVVAPLIAPASEQAVVELDGNAYVIGGYPPGRIPVSEVQIYDSRTNRWRMGPSLPVPMHHTMAAAVDGRLFVIGGEFDGGGTGSVIHQVYRPTLSCA